jgi:hypothetical protein
MMDRRVVSRRRTYLKGLVVFNNGNSTQDCVVRDLTAQGALVELSSPLAPETFDLLLLSSNERRHARIVWRAGRRSGLAFSPA